MQKRKLGNTDIYLSTIGFGGAPIGNLFEKLDDATCYKTLARCDDSNINPVSYTHLTLPTICSV